jgi:hypothetical protein
MLQPRGDLLPRRTDLQGRRTPTLFASSHQPTTRIITYNGCITVPTECMAPDRI